MGSERLARQVLMGRRALLGGGLGLLVGGVSYAVPTGRELGTLVLFDRLGELDRLEVPVDLSSSVVLTRETWSGFRGADILDSWGRSVLVDRVTIQSIIQTKAGGSEFRLKTGDGLPWSDRSLV